MTLEEVEARLTQIIIKLESHKGEGFPSYCPSPQLVSEVIDELLELRLQLGYSSDFSSKGG